MEIYTTPKILIFHLKRFKSSNKYFKSKLEALIDFPVDGLDMSGFVKEANMPSQMNIEGSSSTVHQSI
jgi:ubiquitin carboxyl-terminal hydrolase 4/11/15